MKTRARFAGKAPLARNGAVLLIALSAVASYAAPVRAATAGIFDPAVATDTDGKRLYEQICQGCHMQGGRGAAGAGYFPALAKNRNLASRQFTAVTILTGRRNMPAFGVGHAIGFIGPGVSLGDAQIASVINYVRTHFGNRYRDAVTVEAVRSARR